MGGTPRVRSTGKVMSVPPPARAFTAPPANAAVPARIMAEAEVTRPAGGSRLPFPVVDAVRHAREVADRPGGGGSAPRGAGGDAELPGVGVLDDLGKLHRAHSQVTQGGLRVVDDLVGGVGAG